MRLPIFFVFIILACQITNSRVLKVGPTRAYKTPSEAVAETSDGDTVEIDAGVYERDVAVWNSDNLYVKGIGGRAHLKSEGNAAQKKAIWVINGNNFTVENVEFSECSVSDKNGAGIRQQGTNLTVRNCYFHDNENGILTSNDSDSEILIEYSIFENNGYGDGYTHNMYINRVKKFTLRYCYSKQANIGHCVKSRASENHILYNRIMDEWGGSASMLLDLPNGGESYVVGNVFMQSAAAENYRMVTYGLEGLSNPTNELYFAYNTLVNYRHSCNFVAVKEGADTAYIVNNYFIGGGEVLSGEADTVNNIKVDNIDDAGFIQPDSLNYRINYDAPAVNAALSLSSLGKMDLSQMKEYVHPVNYKKRESFQIMDVGAFEYAPSINTGTIVGAPFCAGEYIDVPFTVEGSFNSGNYFIAQLSDASGDFSSPLYLDSLLGTSSDTIEDVKLPDSLSGCSGYRIRVVSDAPAVVGSDNGSDIAINPLPEPEITSGSVQVCENDEYMYIRETDAGSDYKWKAEGGVIIGDDAGDTVTVAWGGMGAGKLTLVQTAVSGCIDSTEMDVTINALPEPEITSGETSVCAYHEESYACNSSAELEIQWKAIGGEIVGADTNSSVTILWGAAGSATLTLIQTDRDAGCRDSLKQTVTINSSPEAEILSGDSVVCEGDEETYTGRSDPSMEYQWSVSGGTIDGDADNASVIVLWEAPGSGTITLVMSDGDTGCRDTTHKSVTINPLPSVSFACSTDEICENEGDFELSGGSPEGGRYTGDGVISGRFYPARTGAGTFVVTYTYSDNGCENSASDSVVVHPSPEKPTIEERNDTLFCSPAESYQWYFNEERIVSAASRYLVPDGSGHYAVEITDAHSCSNISDNYYYKKTSVNEDKGNRFDLVARPNPFTGETTVYFTLENGSRVSARLIDIMGKEAVNIINSEYMERGANKIDFEAKNMLPGLYYLVLQAGASTETIKLIIIK